jgi:hypothetical protein
LICDNDRCPVITPPIEPISGRMKSTPSSEPMSEMIARTFVFGAA